MRLGCLHTALRLLESKLSTLVAKSILQAYGEEISANLLERSLLDRTTKDRGDSEENSPKVSSSTR